VSVVASGGTYVPDAALEPPPAGRSDLSARQAEIAVLLCEGLSNKQIAGRLALAEGTVKAHLAAIMGRLGTRNRVATVVRLRALGF
jgi:DNA-binding NarL/FixJ family response regulator